jgi:parallel beta-helix repeat protein
MSQLFQRRRVLADTVALRQAAIRSACQPVRPKLSNRPVVEPLESRRLLSGTIEVVNGLDENGGGSPYAGSLRAAIVQANADPGSTIAFTQLAAGTAISLTTALPPITAADTTIDGTTRPGGRVEIDGPSTNVNGLDVQSAGDTIEGLLIKDCQSGITLDTGSSDAVVVNNQIGDVTDTGTGLNFVGIDITGGSHGDTIGGADAADRNVISGATAFSGSGVLIEDPGNQGTTDNLIEGNYVGIDPSGSSALNDEHGAGLELDGVQGNTVENNVISGNEDGIETENGAGTDHGNTIEGNTIGLNAAGTAAVPNGIGVLLNGGSATQGDLVTQNVIADNSGNGSGSGVDIDGSGNMVSRNQIYGNATAGIYAGGSADNNTFSQNTLYGNGTSSGDIGLGIALVNENSVLPDSGTGGTSTAGVNGDQPYPNLTVTDAGDGVNFNVGVSLTSNPDTAYTVELYANTPSAVSPSGYGEGQTYITSVSLVTGLTGIATGTAQISSALYAGDYITATATNASGYDAASNPDAGATSEFSADVAAPGVATPTLSVANASGPPGGNVVFTATLSSAADAAVSANYSVAPGTATTADFNSSGGLLVFPAGSTQETIDVPVYGDTSGGDETFALTLSGPDGAEFASGLDVETAIGTIVPNSSGTLASSIALGASSSSVSVGGSVTLTATVTGSAATPTGLVTFLEGGTSLGTATVGSSGLASIALTTLPAGSDILTASYGGDGTYAASTSAPITVHVVAPSAAAGSVTTLSAAAKTLTVGQTDALTVTVTSAGGTGPTPTGTVAINVNGTEMGTSTLGSDGQAVILLMPSAADSDAVVTANYIGDANYTASSSSAVTQVYLPQSTVAATAARAVVPLAAVAGQQCSAKVPVVATNGGPTLAGEFELVLYADTSATGLDSSPVQLASVVRRANLKTGRSLSVPFVIHSLPESLPTGLYYLAVQITDPLGNASLVTTSDVISVVAPFVSLQASASTPRPSIVPAGKLVSLVVTVTNNGNVTASGPASLTLNPSSDRVTALPIDLALVNHRITIKPGRSARIMVRFRIGWDLEAGIYYPIVDVAFDGVTTTAVGGSFEVE